MVSSSNHQWAKTRVPAQPRWNQRKAIRLCGYHDARQELRDHDPNAVHVHGESSEFCKYLLPHGSFQSNRGRPGQGDAVQTALSAQGQEVRRVNIRAQKIAADVKLNPKTLTPPRLQMSVIKQTIETMAREVGLMYQDGRVGNPADFNR